MWPWSTHLLVGPKLMRTYCVGVLKKPAVHHFRLWAVSSILLVSIKPQVTLQWSHQPTEAPCDGLGIVKAAPRYEK